MDLATALNGAIAFERSVHAHYAQSAERCGDPQGRRIFATLAREEQGHGEFLEARLAEWQTQGLLTVAELPSVLPPVVWIQEAARRIAESTLDPVGAAGNANLPELGFLRQALELEQRANAFYQDLVLSLAPAHRLLFAPFLNVEDGHLALVQAEIDALLGHGHWFDFTDFDPAG